MPLRSLIASSASLSLSNSMNANEPYEFRYKEKEAMENRRTAGETAKVLNSRHFGEKMAYLVIDVAFSKLIKFIN